MPPGQFIGHAEDLERLLGAGAGGGAQLPAAEQDVEMLRRRDDVFPGILPVLAAVLREEMTRAVCTEGGSVVIHAHFYQPPREAVARAGGSGGQRRPVSRLESPD